MKYVLVLALVAFSPLNAFGQDNIQEILDPYYIADVKIGMSIDEVKSASSKNGYVVKHSWPGYSFDESVSRKKGDFSVKKSGVAKLTLQKGTQRLEVSFLPWKNGARVDYIRWESNNIPSEIPGDVCSDFEAKLIERYSQPTQEGSKSLIFHKDTNGNRERDNGEPYLSSHCSGIVGKTNLELQLRSSESYEIFSNTVAKAASPGGFTDF